MTVLRKSFYIHWSAGRSPRVHEVNPGRDLSIPDTEMFGLGGELAKEVDFVFMFCYYFVQAHFVMFSGLLVSLSIMVLY